TYRLPRVLHWLSANRWHWIDTVNHRMNYSGTGFEWLMAPLVVFTRSDRGLFLLNYVPWLLMPGAAFGCLRELGVGGRVAWHWMWLLPLGWCYLLQAGGIGNDSYAALYLLLSVSLALRAQRTRRLRDLWAGALAAALCTGSKASNLPLALPFLIAAWPARWLIPTRKAGSVAVAISCLVVSFLPLAVLNWKHTGSWTGDPQNTGKMELRNPVAGIEGNAMQLIVHNFEPPILASALNGKLDKLNGTDFIRGLKQDYPRLNFATAELPQEEGAGAGAGLGILFLVSLAAWRKRCEVQDQGQKARIAHGYWIAIGAWIALGVYMAKIGSEAGQRLVAAYYPLCIALVLLHPGNARLVRRGWWRAVAFLVALSVFPALILDPGRPLWPAATILHGLPARFRGNAIVKRMENVYEIYSRRPRLFAPFVDRIPSGEKVIGFLDSGDNPASSLWEPFGGRRVVDFYPESEQRIFAEQPHIFIVASEGGIQKWYGEPAEQWIRDRGAVIITHESIIVKIHRGKPENWYLLDVPAPGQTLQPAPP
ncbi:MAG TPA: hypothetical protein VG733_01485, partial [Chthoniobacteraceae bacterium]|nr:hypothetical protein [Chthoniobacteraceae bacterium]